jgi:hypothetical protein
MHNSVMFGIIESDSLVAAAVATAAAPVSSATLQRRLNDNDNHIEVPLPWIYSVRDYLDLSVLRDVYPDLVANTVDRVRSNAGTIGGTNGSITRRWLANGKVEETRIPGNRGLKLADAGKFFQEHGHSSASKATSRNSDSESFPNFSLRIVFKFNLV